MDQLVRNITTSIIIAFSNDEIPSGRYENTKALYITINCKGYTLPRVLLDNRTSVNVIPMATLSRLLVDHFPIWKTYLVVHTFNKTRKEVTENIELLIQTGPCTFNIDFRVMDINPSYNYLLRRPWIHMARAMPFTIHQKVKFVVENNLSA